MAAMLKRVLVAAHAVGAIAIFLHQAILLQALAVLAIATSPAPAAEGEYLVAEHGGYDIVFFTQNYTVGVLQAKWYPGTQAGVSLQYGEAIKPEGGSWSWDLRVPYQAKQAANAQIAALMQPGQVRASADVDHESC